MKCMKCGAEWNTGVAEKISVCPFCGEKLMEHLPHQQSIEAFKMVLERFGVEIYHENKRLYALINDLIPNTSMEKGILKTVISLDAPKSISRIVSNSAEKTQVIKETYSLLENGGLSPDWCASAVYILSMPFGVDTSVLFPLKNEQNSDSFDVNKIAVSYDPEVEDKYSGKSFDELLNLSLNGDPIACTELGERYYSGTNTEQDVETAIAYFTQAADMEYPVAEFILGKLYDEGQVIQHDADMAFKYYSKSAEKNYPPAFYSLGQMYYFGVECEKNDHEALYWVLKAAEELDDSDVYVFLSIIYKDSEDDSIRNEEKAFNYALKAAEMGDENAYNLVGTMYEMGCGVKQSFENAIKYYKLAAENGVEIAYLNIGAFYQFGYGVSKDENKAVEYYQCGANVGNMYCLNALGMCYKDGIGVHKDLKKAFDLFLDAAYAGNYASEFNVALAYDEGQGVEVDKYEAKKWFTLSASHGFSKAMAALGVYAEKGIPDRTPNISEAFEWYLKAAEVGDHPFAAWIVGNCYSQGLMEVQVDLCKAFKWYLLAAELGHPTAQNNVAVEYIKGIIVDLDYTVAVEWFEKAVAQNDMYALDNYGTLLLNGDGVSQDPVRAFNMLKESADMGYPDAIFHVGVCYFEGWGTQRNMNEALRYLTEAYNSGVESAHTYLQKGFNEKNGTWVKRGLFGKVPEPEPLPNPKKPPICHGGCVDVCVYANMVKAKRNTNSDDFCYCELLKRNVFQKSKCPGYKDSFSSVNKKR